METSVATLLPCLGDVALRPVVGPDRVTGQGPPPHPQGSNYELKRIDGKRGAPDLGRPVHVTDRAEPPEVWEGDRPTHTTGDSAKTVQESKEAV